MRRFLCFWWLCVCNAARGNSANANDWQWLFANPLWQGIGSASGGALGIFVSRYWNGAPVVSAETPIGVFLGGLFGFVVTWLFFFIVRFVNEPARLYYAQRDRADAEEEKTRISSAVGGSAFQIAVGESGRFLDTSGSSLYSIKRTLNLKIENNAPSENLSDCKISILKIDPQDEFEGPWTLKEGFSLAAGDSEFEPLVTYGEARTPDKYPCGDSFLEICVPSAAPKLDIVREYTATIRATSSRTAPRDFKCRIWVENGQLRIAPIFSEPPTAQEKQYAMNEIGRLRSLETRIRNEPVKSDKQFEFWESRIGSIRKEIAQYVGVCSVPAQADRFLTVGNLRHSVPSGIEVFNPTHGKLVRIATRDLDWLDEFIAAKS